MGTLSGPLLYPNIIFFKSRKKKRKKVSPGAGIDPSTLWSGGQCNIHSATVPVNTLGFYITFIYHFSWLPRMVIDNEVYILYHTLAWFRSTSVLWYRRSKMSLGFFLIKSVVKSSSSQQISRFYCRNNFRTSIWIIFNDFKVPIWML